MSKFTLDTDQVEELVRNNKYKVNPTSKFISRCIDGRYPNEKDLPALAFPGADAGELALLMATGNMYGFETDGGKILKTLEEVVGGKKNLRLHTDIHAPEDVVCGGCGHVKLLTNDYEAYNLTQDQAEFIKKAMKSAKKNGAEEVVLKGDHQEGAVLIVKGDYGIYPQYKFEMAEGAVPVQVFVFHQSLVDARHKKWASVLVKDKAVKLFQGLDEEYLYQVMSDTLDFHLMETAKRLAKGLPIYTVAFNESGGFEIEEVGKV